MDWIKTNRIVAGIIFVFAFVVYTLTVAPTVSFWDCGEFIATSYKMAVPHPPGSPLFLLVARVFSMVPFVKDIGMRVNMISVIVSAVTIMLLYLSIVQLYREWKGGKLSTKEDWLTAIFSGIIGSLTFAFTHSFWFNSAEAEVYAASMLFTSLLVWLALLWAEKYDQPNNEKYLLMIAYIIGLAIAVHLLNVLAIPFVAMVYYYKKYDVNASTFVAMMAVTGVIMLAVYPGIVKWLPLVAEYGFIWLGVIFLGFLAASFWAVNNRRHLLSIIFLSVTLILIGYSSYSMVVIRSQLNPTIDENNPENIENFLKYMNREQYGEHSISDRTKVWKESPRGRQYHSVWDFFWNYQIQKMYNRYFMWQFSGMDPITGNWNFQFFALPLLLGLIGMFYHFRGDPKHALAVFALFFMTGLAIILYLNQPDPQPRERDYSYVGSFFAFSIWVGLGYAGLLEMVREFLKDEKKKLAVPVMAAIFAIGLLASPVQLLAKNFHIHNRSGNYVAWDYSYNMLMSCDKDAILFTNGDNDTFPLWYLQEVENIRTDVRLVNLSLLNTDWYIRQLRDLPPKVPMHIREDMLKRLGPIPWKKQEVSLQVPPQIADSVTREFQAAYKIQNIQTPKEIKFEVKPTMNYGQYELLRTQDYMILNILAANRWKRPVYFATTVPRSNLVGGLEQYLRMEGLVLKVTPFKNWTIDAQKMEENLFHRYKYRLSDPSVYFNPSIISLLQNYRTAFIQLGEYYVSTNAPKEKLVKLEEEMQKAIPDTVIPWTNRALVNFHTALKMSIDSSAINDYFKQKHNTRELADLAQVFLFRLNRADIAARLLEFASANQADSESLIGLLIEAYKQSGQYEKAIALLEKMKKKYPQDKSITRMMGRLETQLRMKSPKSGK